MVLLQGAFFWPHHINSGSDSLGNDVVNTRNQWSKLTGLQLGRYAEHWAKLRLIEAGYEVYSAEVDDRGIDLLVRVGPGRCLEIQVKSVRNRNHVFIEVKRLGATREEVAKRLRCGYCVLFMLFSDGNEPQIYLIPGYAWLNPNSAIKELPPDSRYERSFGILSSKKNEPLLEPYRLNDRSVATIVETIKDQIQGRKG